MRASILTPTVASLLLAAQSAVALPSNSAPLAQRDLSSIVGIINSLNVVGHPENDFNCKSSVHKNPVVLLHALLSNPDVDLNLLQRDMKAKGYCTYATKYGAHAIPSWIGGLTDMRAASREIADFILEVADKTGADKVDVIGHSEGGVMSLYTPMQHADAAEKVERIVALGPAIHGAQYYGLTNLWFAGGDITRDLASATLKFLGCEACDQMATGGDIYDDMNNGTAIVRAGTKPTVIMSTSDTLVAPDVSRIEEPGVRNIFVQDRCPDDKVGHAGLAWDTGVWDMIYNELSENHDGPVTCTQGLPVKN